MAGAGFGAGSTVPRYNPGLPAGAVPAAVMALPRPMAALNPAPAGPVGAPAWGVPGGAPAFVNIRPAGAQGRGRSKRSQRKTKRKTKRVQRRRYRGGMDPDGDDPMNGPPVAGPAAAGAGAGAGAAPLALPPAQLLVGPPAAPNDPRNAAIGQQFAARLAAAPPPQPGGLLLIGPPAAPNAPGAAAIAANNRRIAQEFAARLGRRGGSRRRRSTKKRA